MKWEGRRAGCIPIELITAFAVDALPAQEATTFSLHVAECAECQRELDSIRPLARSMRIWPMDVLQPAASLWERLALRIAGEAGTAPLASAVRSDDPPWNEVAAGIACKHLSTDSSNDHVSMLVRLNPATDYPPHQHADVEELHLLEGELWIDERKLVAGDYHRGEAGTTDRRVWSETGCTCVLTTSARDRLTL